MLLVRCRHQCSICLERAPLDLHHLIPRSEGGSNDEENLIVLCGNCHDRYHRQKAYTVNQLRMYKEKMESAVHLPEIHAVIEDYLQQRLASLHSLPSNGPVAEEALPSMSTSPIAKQEADGESLDEDQVAIDLAGEAEAQGDLARAVEIYALRLRHKTVDVAIPANLALLHLRMGRFDKAVRLFDRLKEGGHIGPDLAHAYGRTLLEVGRFGEAVSVLEEVLAQEDKPMELILDAVVANGACGNYERVKELIDFARNAGMDRIEVRILEAMVAESEGKLRDAVEKFRSVQSFAENDQPLIERIVVDLFHLGDFEGCITALEELEAKDRQHELLQIAPHALIVLGRTDEALRRLESRQDLGLITVNEILSWVDLYVLLGDIDGATVKAAEAVRRDPRNPVSRATFGDLLARTKEYRKALEQYAQGMPETPLFARSWSLRGVCCSKLGMHEEAIDTHQVAVRLGPEDAVCHYNLACAYALSGRQADAKKSLARATELDPVIGAGALTDSDLEGIVGD